MAIELKEIIRENEGFHTSVNIAFDFGSSSKVSSLIPTESVCRYVEEIISDVLAPSSMRAKVLVGAYGKGKSHITLAALMAMWSKDVSAFSRLIDAYRERGSEFGDDLERFVSEGDRLLPVIISGNTSDLRHSLLLGLKSALLFANLEHLLPATNYDGALEVLERWRANYPETLAAFERIVGRRYASFVAELKNFDTAAYNDFVAVYPKLTSGGTYDALFNSDVISVYEAVLDGLFDEGYSGIYVVYDEFSKYLEANIDQTSVEDIKLLQDFAEKCNRSAEKQLHMLLISHKSLENYIDARLPKEKVDGWRGVSGRFREVEIADSPSQAYELISNAIFKDASLWMAWHDEHELELIRTRDRYENLGLFGGSDVDLVTFGCAPLHPVTTFLLPRLSERVAQNERTLFTYLASRESGSLVNYLATSESNEVFVSPDSIYDYFEPLLRKEFYTSPIHRLYELTRSALSKTGGKVLESRIVKTIALVHLVAQFEAVPPTKQTILDIYSDCGFDVLDIERAIESLVESDSVVYLRKSNSYLKLKESSGVRVVEEIERVSEKKKAQSSPVEVLNRYQSGRAAYPSRHNELTETIRYFDLVFADKSILEQRAKSGDSFSIGGDGAIVALLPSGPDELRQLESAVLSVSATRTMDVFVLPKKFASIEDALYKCAAASQLREEAGGDEILSEEYEMVVEDYSEIIADFIASFFSPELGRSRYFVRGEEKAIRRRTHLSQELSDLCDAAYPNTPVVRNETINKNILTGAALHSRAKILQGVCGTVIEPNLGFVGTGQETAIMRSVYGVTGVIRSLSSAPEIDLAPDREDISFLLETISGFIDSADGASFLELYDLLISDRVGIGMKRGLVPLFVAVVLRSRRDEILITRDGVEKPLTGELLGDIDAHPEKYRISLVEWDKEKADYVRVLAELFGCVEGSAGKSQVASAMRRWYFSLPQFTRNATCSLVPDGDDTMRLGLFKLLKTDSLSSQELLFDRVPGLCESPANYAEVCASIEETKHLCDRFLERHTELLAEEVKGVFAPSHAPSASLKSVVDDWMDGLPETTASHVFSGSGDKIMQALRGLTFDERTSFLRLAKAATSLRVEDWGDRVRDEFIPIISRFKMEVDSFSPDEEASSAAGSLRISFTGEDGKESIRSFDSVECSPRARLLRNEIVTAIEEMGQAVSKEEARQVLFDVLRSMC